MKKWIAANKWWLLTAAWLYTLSFVFNHYWSKSSSYESVTRSFYQRINRQLDQFTSFCNDTASIRRLAAFQVDSTKQVAGDKDVYYYLFSDSPDGMVLKYWSSSAIVPATDDVPYHDTVKLVKLTNGIYILASHKVPNSLLTAIQLTLVKQEYYVQNKSLQTEYAGFPGLEKHVAISDVKTIFPVKTDSGQTLFYLKPIGDTGIVVFNWISLTMQIITTVLLMIFFYRVGLGLAQAGRIKLAICWMITAVLLIRLSINYIGFPVNVAHLELFKPMEQNRGWFFSSPGGLMLNLMGLLWLIFFFIRTRSIWLLKLEKLPQFSKKWIAAIVILGLLPVTFFMGRLIVRIVLQPDISFDVTNFFSLGWNTVCAIICIYFICVLHYRIMHLCNQVFIRLCPAKAHLKYFIIAAAGLLVLTAFIQILQVKVLVMVLVWLLASLLLEDKLPGWFFRSMERVVRFVFWLIWYAFAGTLLVQSQHATKEQKRKLQMARSLAAHSDTEAESLIYQSLNDAAMKQLKSVPLLAQDSGYNSYIKQNIIHTFTGNMAGYTTTPYYFDSTGHPYYNTDSATYETLNTIIEEQGKKTKFDNIYFYEKDFDKFIYIIRQPLRQDSLNGGYLFITCIPAIYNGEALAPELFNKPLQENSETTTLYHYAVYDHGSLLYSSHNFPFTTMLPAGKKLRSEYEITTLYGKEALWYNAGNQRIIIIVKVTGLFSEMITLFAYIFGCFMILYLKELLLARLLTGAYQLGPWWRLPQLSIRSKIRRTVILISLLSFVLIGVTTVYFFINRYQSANNKRLTQLITQVENDLQTLANIEELFQQSNVPGYRNDYAGNSSTVSLVAELLNTGINLFDLQGDLTATSQSIIYDRGIIAPKMNPAAYYKMAVQHQVQYLQTESIGNLNYQGVYLPVRYGNGAAIGFINIPYFASQVELNQEISNFLVTLINLIAFIFIISGIVAFFITNSLTSSFFIIGEKMKAISLGTTNEPIIWNHKDEIGVLVRQYNKMLEQLDDSARKLATSERENAWREMAKQVAHEIKNPLTPMKLNLQYLQRQIENNSPNVLSMTKNIAANLVTQIDHLSQIASDFSQFARINVSHLEKFDIHEVLKQIIMLYNMDSHIYITWNKAGRPVMIEADRTHINRLFTNLIKNAYEAVSDKEALITITEQPEPSAILISVTDNGPGIPAEMKDQLFEPSFTTKNSGTGLGLAICKDIVERAGGAIWFQSGNGQATTFFVRLPVVKD